MDLSPKYGLVEFFSGQGEVSKAFRDCGHTVASFDYNLGEEMDFLSPAGFALLGCESGAS